MISANDLDGLLTVLKKHGANVLRYKTGTGDSGEEIEIIIPVDGAPTEIENLDKSNGKPRLNLIGFSHDEDESDD